MGLAVLRTSNGNTAFTLPLSRDAVESARGAQSPSINWGMEEGGKYVGWQNHWTRRFGFGKFNRRRGEQISESSLSPFSISPILR